MDEFAITIHLIHRKLNGYGVPNQLPPELVPPFTRNFAESIGTVKSLGSQDAETREKSSAFLQPQQTGVSYRINSEIRPRFNIRPTRLYDHKSILYIATLYYPTYSALRPGSYFRINTGISINALFPPIHMVRHPDT